MAFLASGGGRHGLGHVYRSLAIAKGLSTHSHYDIRFSANSDDSVQDLLAKSGFAFGQRGSGNIDSMDFPQADLWVVDVPEFGAGYIKRLRQAWPGTRIIALEFSDYGSDCPDAIINLFDQKPAEPRPPHWVKYHEGLEYGIIREEFAPYQTHVSSTMARSNVLVCFGSSDVRDCTANVIEASSWIKETGTSYEVVLGPNVQGRENILTKIDRSPAAIRVHSSPSNLPEIMAGCGLAVCAGGTTMMELAFLGVPAVIIAQTSVEDRLAKLLATKGCATVLDNSHGNDPRKIAETLENLLSDPDRLREMRKHGQRTIDGLGVTRILGVIERTLAEAG